MYTLNSRNSNFSSTFEDAQNVSLSHLAISTGNDVLPLMTQGVHFVMRSDGKRDLEDY